MRQRTHVVLPDDLVRQIDDLVGTRKRSEFIERALREQLRRARQAEAIEKGFGVLKDAVPEYWSTPEKVDAWREELRRQDLAIDDEKRTARNGGSVRQSEPV